MESKEQKILKKLNWNSKYTHQEYKDQKKKNEDFYNRQSKINNRELISCSKQNEKGEIVIEYIPNPNPINKEIKISRKNKENKRNTKTNSDNAIEYDLDLGRNLFKPFRRSQEIEKEEKEVQPDFEDYETRKQRLFQTPPISLTERLLRFFNCI